MRLLSDGSKLLATNLRNGAHWATKQPGDSTPRKAGLQADKKWYRQPSQTHNYLLAQSRLCNLDSHDAILLCAKLSEIEQPYVAGC